MARKLIRKLTSNKRKGIYQGSSEKSMSQGQAAAPKRSYMQDKAKRDTARAASIKEAQSSKNNLAMEFKAREEANAAERKRILASGGNAEVVGMRGNIQRMGDKAKLAEADKKIADASKVSEFDKGRDRAIEILGDEGLGRLEEDKDIQKLLQESEGREGELAKYTKLAEGQLDRQKGLTSRYEQMADQGMSPEAREARRVADSQRMAKQEQIAGMRLGASMGGAKGASAMAQQRSLAAQGMMGRAGIERDIFLENEKAKERGLQGMAVGLQGEQAAITGIGQGQQMQQAAFESRRSAVGEMKTYDMGQAAAEKELIASLGMQYEQMSSAERQAKMAADAQVKAGKAQCHIAGTKVLMKDTTYKNIEDIQIGDVVMIGGEVLGCGSLLNHESLYTLNNEIFTASHLIFDKLTKQYTRADESVDCTLHAKEANVIVYPLFTENRCYVTSFVSGDFGMETDYREEREDVTYSIEGIHYGKN